MAITVIEEQVSMPVLLLLLLLAVCGTTSAEAQEVVTRWTRLQPHVLEEFVRTAGASRRDADAIMRRIGEGAEGSVMTLLLRDSPGRVELELVDEIGYVYVRARGAEADVVPLGEVLRAYWLRSLLPLPGEIAITVDPVQRPDGLPPILRLGYRTLHHYGCVGYAVAADLERSDGVLHLEIHGVDRPGFICAPALTPARGGVDLELPEGDHPLTVRYRDAVDGHYVQVRGTWTQVRPWRTAFTEPDTTRKLLFPERSLALYCRAGRLAALCDQLANWVGSRSGVVAFTFDEHGVSPYRRPGPRHYFRYADPANLDPVWDCLDRAGQRVRQLVRGPGFEIETWTGERGRPAGSREGASTCLASIPDSAAAEQRSVDEDRAGYYRTAWASKFYWGPGREFAVDPDTGRQLPVRIEAVGGTIRATAPFSMPNAVIRPGPAPPVILPPNHYTDALSRAEFHTRLEEWLRRGGRTVGDPEDHPATAWLWVVVENRLDWYFLLGETTAEGVRAYFDLVDRHGPEVAWRVADERADSPQQVMIGPDRVVIPEFELYRWRDPR